jgi:hypothetical protein
LDEFHENRLQYLVNKNILIIKAEEIKPDKVDNNSKTEPDLDIKF